MNKMIIFCDVGRKGAISCFEKNRLIWVNNFCLSKNTKQPIKEKLLTFEQFLKKQFTNQDKITDVGCFQPFGTNRKTIINLAMMTAILMWAFKNANFHFINEWTAWKIITQQQIIPTRAEKKILTIQWVKDAFAIPQVNDDEADAILGGYFLVQKLNNCKD